MDTTYTDIQLKLEPYKDKAFYFPLSLNEVTNLQKQIGQNFPDYYRQFLLTFGIRQDFVFELFKREEDFADQYKWLPKKLRRDFVPIGGSSAGGDTWLIKSNSEEQKIYELWHEGNGELTELDFSFKELIEKNISELGELFERKPFNKDKNWCVQFSIQTTKETELLKTINAQQTKGWTDVEVSSAGVRSFETEIELASKKIRLSRQEFKGWQKPIYYFNWKEPAYQIGAGSFIRTLNEKLIKAFKGYKLIDYGILALADD